MSKKVMKMRVGVRSTHQSNRIDQLRFGGNGYGCKSGDFRLVPENMPVDVFMRDMARKWGRNG